jgi:glycosyltransferase involved in cell wall biosynthesis
VGFVKYAVVVAARNEEKYIEKTLAALKQQTVLPDQIIVVDDGSTDRTGRIASNYADAVIKLPDREYSVVGKPELAKVVNEGLRQVEKDVDYVLICGADHVLPKDYFEAITSRMKANPKIVVASGRIRGEPHFEFAPRGSGRVVDADFWREVSNLQYPVEWGWESWLFYKAMQLGYEVRCFRDIVTDIERPTRLGKAGLWGKGMYALGYDWKYALGRCVLTFFKSPKAGLGMFLGWLLHKNVKRLDIADWVNQMQKKRFWKRVLEIIKRRGRR